jgi:hypothetical protein
VPALAAELAALVQGAADYAAHDVADTIEIETSGIDCGHGGTS